jgi:hypothetical protein
MVLTSDNERIELGLGLKVEALALRVIGYSRKNEHEDWEFSQNAVDLIKEYKVNNLCDHDLITSAH